MAKSRCVFSVCVQQSAIDSFETLAPVLYPSTLLYSALPRPQIGDDARRLCGRMMAVVKIGQFPPNSQLEFYPSSSILPIL